MIVIASAHKSSRLAHFLPIFTFRSSVLIFPFYLDTPLKSFPSIMAKPLRITKDNRRTWTTPEQSIWLQERISPYLEAKRDARRGLQVFWQKLYKDWFSRWPETATSSSLTPQANSTNVPGSSEEDIEAVSIVKLVSACYSVHFRAYSFFWL